MREAEAEAEGSVVGCVVLNCGLCAECVHWGGSCPVLRKLHSLR